MAAVEGIDIFLNRFDEIRKKVNAVISDLQKDQVSSEHQFFTQEEANAVPMKDKYLNVQINGLGFIKAATPSTETAQDRAAQSKQLAFFDKFSLPILSAGEIEIDYDPNYEGTLSICGREYFYERIPINHKNFPIICEAGSTVMRVKKEPHWGSAVTEKANLNYAKFARGLPRPIAVMALA